MPARRGWSYCVACGKSLPASGEIAEMLPGTKGPVDGLYMGRDPGLYYPTEPTSAPRSTSRSTGCLVALLVVGGLVVALGALAPTAPKPVVLQAMTAVEPPRAPPPPSALAEPDAVARVIPAVVHVQVPHGVGTGVVVTPDGYILTNEHVVGQARSAEVRLQDGRTVTAAVERVDAKADLAVLRAPLSSAVAAQLADVRSLRLGEPLLAIGYALNQRGDPSVTRGVFSALRDVRGFEHVQTDAAINGGNSGGPLISYRGEVVGILRFSLEPRVGAAPIQGINFAVSAREVRRFLQWSS
jgi:S1-C subfamily serine protease